MCYYIYMIVGHKKAEFQQCVFWAWAGFCPGIPKWWPKVNMN